jgi:hypothetical protein
MQQDLPEVQVAVDANMRRRCAGRVGERCEAGDERLLVLHHHPRFLGELRRQVLDARSEDGQCEPRLTHHVLGRGMPRARLGRLHAEHRIVFRPRQRQVQLRDALAEQVGGFEIAADGVARFGGDAASLGARAGLSGGARARAGVGGGARAGARERRVEIAGARQR